MVILRFFSVLLLVIFLINSYAKAESQVVTNAELAKHHLFVVVDQEGGKWFYSVIQAKPGKLQNVISTVYFTELKDLHNHIKKNVSQQELTQTRQFENLVQTEQRDRVIWATENTWSWEWEQKYSQWVIDNVDENYLYNNNVATDCADVAISLRWIFARINKLPAAQSLVGTGALFSNESFKTAWNHLPTHEDWTQDLLFRKALDYVLENTYTHSLWKDSYPIHISKDTFLAGTHHINLFGSTGHTMFVNKFEDTNFKMIYSDVPRTVRMLYGTQFSESLPVQGKTGFLKIRWPTKTESGWKLVPRIDMEHYSLNQYDPELENNEVGNYTIGFLMALGYEPKIVDYFYDILINLYYGFYYRIDIVTEGYEFCLQNDCAPGSENYEAYSTPSRDNKILKSIKKIQQILNQFSESHPNILEEWNDAKQWGLDINEVNHTIDYLTQNWLDQKYSSDPRDQIWKRWGFDAPAE